MESSPDPSVQQLLEALRGVLAQAAEPVHVLRTILQQAVTQTGADRGVFAEVSRDGELHYQVLHRFDKAQLASGAGSFSRAVFGEVLRSGEAVRIGDARNDPRFFRSESVHDLRLVSVLSVPIRVGGQVGAIVHLEKDQPSYFLEGHQDLLKSLVEVAGPILEALRAGNRVLAERDQLRDSAARFREEVRESREVLSRDWSFGRFVGRSPAVAALEETVRRAAQTDFPVLIGGETGTGKSLVARIVHHSGPRSQRAFVTVFCPSFEKGMVENELFGHRRGAFTGAVADRIGKVQAAEKGTLFLDEVGELPPEVQPKLLRLLQEKTYERVGDPAERTADVRLIAATNKDLRAEVRAGRFRLDLYERLHFIPVSVPPLRDRREDIPLLLRHALDRHDAGRWVVLSEEANDFLTDLDYAWPGNVRELEQLSAQLAMDRKGSPVTAEDLRGLLAPRLAAAAAEGAANNLTHTGAASGPGLPALLDRAERALLEKALEEGAGLTRAELAAKLGISERVLYKKLRLYGLGG